MPVLVILLLADHSVVGDLVVSLGSDGGRIEAGFFSELLSLVEFCLEILS